MMTTAEANDRLLLLAATATGAATKRADDAERERDRLRVEVDTLHRRALSAEQEVRDHEATIATLRVEVARLYAAMPSARPVGEPDALDDSEQRFAMLEIG